jgi:endonuclease III
MKSEERKKKFLEVFRLAKKKYGKNSKRLAGEKWGADWKTLIATIMSAQSRDETTIPIAEKLFEKYDSLNKLSRAKNGDVLKILRSMNYNKTKTKHVISAAKFILKEFDGKLPSDIGEMTRIPGVGRKTANLVLSEEFGRNTITVDTHCHRLANVLGLVRTKTPYETELALQKIAPKKYWKKINRLFVLWGKDVAGRDKNKILDKLKD